MPGLPRHLGVQHRVCGPVGVSTPFTIAEAVQVGFTAVNKKPAGGEYEVPVQDFMLAFTVTTESVQT